MFYRLNKGKQRAICVFLCIIMMFTVLLIRIAYIQNGSASEVVKAQSEKKILLGQTRGYIYDRNYSPLVNEEKNEYSVFLTDMFSSQSDGSENGDIKNGICISQSDLLSSESAYFKRYYRVERYSEDSLCEHIIGYTDSQNNGVSGIEKAFNTILKNAAGELYVEYKSDANGFALVGDGIELSDENYDSQAGIVLTIDKNIQTITQNAMEQSQIKTGAAVVMDVNTFEIYAMVSVPTFDRADIAKSLQSDFQPFYNRALGAYPVGSVFKPIVAVSAIENGIKPENEFDCVGYCKIGNNVFNCYNTNAHGKTDLNKAIEKSCNTYFIELAIKTGRENLYKTAALFGFGKKIELCTTLISDAGVLPQVSDITSDASLAMLGFGQGELTATPLQLAAAYCVLANGGYYREPILLKELVDSEKQAYAYYKSEVKYSVCSEETCEQINICLYNNMLNGTGESGKPTGIECAGKTATAQTGQYNSDSEERLCTWFAGFFPYDEPKYAVVVFNENGSTASVDCAPVFKKIVEEITYLEKNN